jgi:hypothetical protein
MRIRQIFLLQLIATHFAPRRCSSYLSCLPNAISGKIRSSDTVTASWGDLTQQRA